MNETTGSSGVTIRNAAEVDVPLILQFIRELAEYERMSEYVTATEPDLRAALFGPRPYAEAMIAFAGDEPAGYALYFHDYSTFRGRPGMYLEDLYVRAEHRHRGVGKALMARLARICVERECHRLQWAVLNWNELALRFYRSLGAAPTTEWTIYSVEREALARLSASPRSDGT